MNKNSVVLIVMLFIAKLAFADGDLHWTPDVYTYQYTMSVMCYVNLDGIDQNVTTLELGAFVGNECRGAQRAVFYQSLPNHKYLWPLYLHGDTGHIITLKLYDHASGRELDVSCDETITFVINGKIGSALNPHEYDFTTNTYTFVGSNANSFNNPEAWNVASNWRDHNGNTVTSMPLLQYQFVLINGFARIPENYAAKTRVLSINSGKVLFVGDNACLEVTESLSNNDAARLVIEDGGQLFQTSNNVAATFKMNVLSPTDWHNVNDNTGWQFVSFPMTNASVSAFIPTGCDYDIYKWNGSNLGNNQYLSWVNYKSGGEFESVFQIGRGYLVSYEVENTASIQGILNAGTTHSFAVTYDDNNEWENFSLLGNPYPFDINWNDFSKHNVYAGGFAVVDEPNGVIGYVTSQNIKAGDGFMVYATGANPSLNYVKGSGGKNRDDVNSINVTVSNTTYSDNAIANFDDAENGGFKKFENFNRNAPKVYFMRNGLKYGILSYDNDEYNIPLYFKANAMGKYTIKLDYEGTYNYLHLIDKLSGSDVDMLLEKDYEFYAGINDYHDRFIIKINKNAVETANDIFVYQSGKELFFADKGVVEIVDMLGRVVLDTEITNVSNGIDINGLESNVLYVIRLTNDGETKTQKIILL